MKKINNQNLNYISSSFLHLLIVSLLLSFFNEALISQETIKIISVDQSNYPKMKAEVVVTNNSNQEVRNLSNTDIKIKDGGKDRATNSVFCSPNVKKFSLVLTIDKTGSMNSNPADIGDNTNLNTPWKSTIAKNSAIKIIDVLPFDRCEAGITEFSSGTTASIQRMFFTTDRDSLKKDVNKIAFGGATDINSGFLGHNGNRGALDLAAFARWKPFIIFLTDGLHAPQSTSPKGQALKTGEIIARANAINATVFIIGLGVDLSANPISTIAQGTNGRLYNNLTSQAELEGVLSQILQLAQLDGNLAPCEIEWDTDCDGGDLEVEFQLGNKPKDTFTYVINPLKLPILNTTRAANNTILNIPVGGSQAVDVVIDAQQNFLNITGFSSTIPEFEVSNWGGTNPPFKLNKGESRTIKVSYKPTDKNCKEGVVTLLSSDACTIKPINLKGGTVLIEDINVGFATKGVTKTAVYTSKFCNNSCDDIEITGYKVGGNNLTEFKVNNAIKVLKSGECLDMDISYTPVDVQLSTATYTIVAKDGNEYTANITGTGSGLPEILANDLAFGAISCGETEQDVAINNSGAIDLNITSITLSNTVDFSLVGANPTIVPAGGTVNVRVKFRPSNKNPNFTSDMTIINDSDNDKNKIVKITAQKNQIDFVTNLPSIDFGIVCPNEVITRDVEFTNLSNVEIDFLGSSVIGTGYSVDKSNWKLNTNLTDKVTITFTSGADGTFTGVWTIIDETCKEKTINVNLTAQVVTSVLNAPNTNFTATIGNSDDKIIAVANPTDRDMLVDLSTDNAQYTIVQPTTVTNVLIAKNSSINVIVRFTPDKNNPLPNSNLIAKTNACNYTGNFNLIGDPKFATADLIIDETYSGLIGDKITIPVKLRNKFEVLATGAKTINFTIEFDATLLEPTGTTPVGTIVGGKRRLPLTINLNGTNADQDLNLDFIIADGGAVTETDITFIANQTVDNNSIALNIDNGKFTVILVNLKAKIFPVAAKPGDVIDFPLYVRDKNKSLQNFHKGIKTFVRYNTTTTEVLGLPSTVYNSDSRFRDVEISQLINFSEINRQNNSPILNAEPGDILLTTLKIRALLGNEIVSDIIIYNSTTIEGKVTIEADTAQFTILGVCIDLDGSARLINPLIVNSGVNIKPNPTSSIFNIDFTPIESGFYSLKLVNMAGAVISELVNEEIIISNTSNSVDNSINNSINKQANSDNYRVYNFNLDATNFTNGVYFVILNTPSQNFVEKLNISK